MRMSRLNGSRHPQWSIYCGGGYFTRSLLLLLLVYLYQHVASIREEQHVGRMFVMAADDLTSECDGTPSILVERTAPLGSDHAPRDLQQQDRAANATGNKNFRFDPDAVPANFTRFCRLPAFQPKSDGYLPPPPGFCGNSSVSGDGISLFQSASEEVLHRLAVTYAPILYVHPLEQYSFMSMPDYFANASAGNLVNVGPMPYTFDEKLNLTSVLRSSREPNIAINSQQFALQRRLYPENVAGSGFDPETGKSNAEIYYNMFEWENGTIAINYHFYFAFHGYANLLLSTLPPYNSEYTDLSGKKEPAQVYRFNAPEFDGHEGDWQSVRVLVCDSALTSIENEAQSSPTVPTPLAVSYGKANNAWLQTMDCTTGQCIFFKDTYHPVGFVSLGDHSVYPQSTRNIVLYRFESNFILSLQGVYAVSHTLFRDDNGRVRYFAPNMTNVVRYKEPDEISIFTTSEEDYWQAFGGAWGTTKLDFELNTTVSCLGPNQTSFVACPTVEEDQVFTAVLELLRIEPPSSLAINVTSLLFNSVGSFFTNTGASPRSPATLPFFRRWEPPIDLPISNEFSDSNATESAICAEIFSYASGAVSPPNVSTIPLPENVIGLVAFCVLLVTLSMIAYTTWICLGHRSREFVESGHRGDLPAFMLWFNVHRPAVHYTFFYTVTLTGIVLFFAGYRDLTYFGLIDVNVVVYTVEVFGALIVAIDTIFAVCIWLTVEDLYKRVKSNVFNPTTTEEIIDSLGKMEWKGYERRSNIFRFLHAFVFASLIFATFVVVYGIIQVGISYGFTLACRYVVVATVDEFCFALELLGVSFIPCGAPFDEFCNRGSPQKLSMTLWGSFLAITGHFYLVSSASATSMHFRYVRALLVSTYPDSLMFQDTSRKSASIDRDEDESFIRHENDGDENSILASSETKENKNDQSE